MSSFGLLPFLLFTCLSLCLIHLRKPDQRSAASRLCAELPLHVAAVDDIAYYLLAEVSLRLLAQSENINYLSNWCFSLFVPPSDGRKVYSSKKTVYDSTHTIHCVWELCQRSCATGLYNNTRAPHLWSAIKPPPLRDQGVCVCVMRALEYSE